MGRPTTVQKTTRVDTISGSKKCPRLTKKQEQEEREQLVTTEKQIANKLAEKRVFDVSCEDTEYLKVISEARAKIERCVDSSMP